MPVIRFSDEYYNYMQTTQNVKKKQDDADLHQFSVNGVGGFFVVHCISCSGRQVLCRVCAHHRLTESRVMDVAAVRSGAEFLVWSTEANN